MFFQIGGPLKIGGPRQMPSLPSAKAGPVCILKTAMHAEFTISRAINLLFPNPMRERRIITIQYNTTDI